MTTTKTPGVFVEEVTTLPQSVAEVETAIPVFLAYTQIGDACYPLRIESMLDFQEHFGGADLEKSISVTVQGDKVESVTIDPAKRSKNLLFYALQMFYAQGGGLCWIVPTGNFEDAPNASLDVYMAALAAIEKEAEPTIIVFPDAQAYLPADQYYSLMNEALMQCEKLGDRFAIIDVVENGDPQTAIDNFRNKITANPDQAKYGAAYWPYLLTTLSYCYDETAISVNVAADPDKAKQLGDATQAAEGLRKDATDARAEADKLKIVADASKDPNDIKAADKANKKATDLELKATAAEKTRTDLEAGMKKQNFKELSNSLQNQIKQKIRDLPVILPPAATMAGVYANVDTTKGVWKAPANVSLNLVDAPVSKITDEDQRSLNVDTIAGKSINAIRSFIGKGTLVWGARTLDGNSNEWRYISVRRTFIMMEQSIRLSTGWFVFEINYINTWTQVRAMIENFLTLLWRQGALMGAKPDEAFFVRVGLGQTMSINDVEEGRMIIEVGVSVVRPAEFIIIRVSHLMQQGS
jgi:phage tail sheath protein FI